MWIGGLQTKTNRENGNGNSCTLSQMKQITHRTVSEIFIQGKEAAQAPDIGTFIANTLVYGVNYKKFLLLKR